MQGLSEETWEVFERVLYGEMSLSQFEEWLYQHPGIETIIGADFYTDLLSFNFRNKAAPDSLAGIIAGIYHKLRPGKLCHDRARRLAKGIIDGKFDFVECVRGLASLRHQGNEWIPIVFVGINSDLDEIPGQSKYYLWDRNALSEKIAESREIIEHSKISAIVTAKRMLGLE